MKNDWVSAIAVGAMIVAFAWAQPGKSLPIERTAYPLPAMSQQR